MMSGIPKEISMGEKEHAYGHLQETEAPYTFMGRYFVISASLSRYLCTISGPLYMLKNKTCRMHGRGE